MTLVFAAPAIPRREKILHREQAANPLHPTSIHSQQAFQPFLRHASVSSWYLARMALVGFFHAVLLRDYQLHQEDFLGGSRSKHHIWSPVLLFAVTLWCNTLIFVKYCLNYLIKSYYNLISYPTSVLCTVPFAVASCDFPHNGINFLILSYVVFILFTM